MPPTPDCLPQVLACRTRLARIDPVSGVPIPGPNNLYVTDALVTLAAKWAKEAGDEIKEKDGCGDLAVYYKGQASLLRMDLTITLVQPDPQVSEMLSGGGSTITDGTAIGFAAPPLGTVSPNDCLSVELWTKRIRKGKVDTVYPYAWWVYPWTMNWSPGDHDHGDKNLALTFDGEAYENPNWFDGPANDWPATTQPTQVFQWIPCTAAHLPPAACGYQATPAS